MTTCTYCGGPGAPNERVMCLECWHRLQLETASPPLPDEAVRALSEFIKSSPRRTICRVSPVCPDCDGEGMVTSEVMGLIRCPRCDGEG